MGGDSSRHVHKALEVARLLSMLADEVDAETEDSGSAVVGAVMRDCAFQIRRAAEREKEARRRRGTWQGGAHLSMAASEGCIFIEKNCTGESTAW